MTTRRAAKPKGREQRADSAPSSLAEPSVLVALTLTALVVLVYQQTRHFQFIDLDDPTYVTANANVQAGLTWANVLWAFTTGHPPYWHPITWLSHMLDVELFGLDAGAHHVTNVVIHAANTLLLFAWLRQTTAAFWKAAFVAAVFAIHPLHVESVAWVTERKDVLGGFFWILTLWAYVSYTARPSGLRYLRVVGAFGLALMSKPSAVTLPAVLLLVDVWPLRRATFSGDRATWMRLVLEKLPLFGLAVATSAVTILIQAHMGAVSDLGTLSLGARVLNAVVDYFLYLGKMAWPAHLAAFYPLRRWSIAIAAAAALGLLAVTLATLRVRRTHPYVLVGWLWYLVTLVPMIGLVQVGAQAIADRFMYLPMIGLLIIVSWGVPDLVARWPGSADRRLVPALGATLIVMGTLTAHRTAASWSDDVALWQHASRSTENNYLAYMNLGSALVKHDDLAGAQSAYASALAALKNEYPAYRAAVHVNIGLVYARQGRTADALEEFSLAARLNPRSAEAELNEGTALASLGQTTAAVEHFSAALEDEPDDLDALIAMGSALLTRGQPSAAIRYYVEAARIAPNSAETHNGLGSALAMAGRRDDAIAEFQRALRLKPDLTSGYFNLALLFASAGRFDEARQNVEQALRLDPFYAPAQQLLATLPKVSR
jgi:tetratricopeptide (TPR) repeat protein